MRGSNAHLSYHGAGSGACFMVKTEARNGDGPCYIWVANDNDEPSEEDYGIEGGEAPSDEEEDEDDDGSAFHTYSQHSPRIRTHSYIFSAYSIRILSHSAQIFSSGRPPSRSWSTIKV